MYHKAMNKNKLLIAAWVALMIWMIVGTTFFAQRTTTEKPPVALPWGSIEIRTTCGGHIVQQWQVLDAQADILASGCTHIHTTLQNDGQYLVYGIGF